MIGANLLKEKLAAGKPVLGTWCTLASPLAAEVLAEAGLDFAIVDFEHGPFDLGRAHELCARLGLHGCSPLVRVPANEPWMVLQALDQGAHGVVVPQAAGKEAAERLVRAAKYHPEGQRGFTPFSRPGGFGKGAPEEYAKRANLSTLTVAIVESRAGLDGLDAMLKVKGLDVVYFGAYDLSQSLGFPGQPKHPKVVAAIEKAAAKVEKAGKAAGGFVPRTKDDVKWLLDRGLRFVTYGVDSNVLLEGYKGVADWFPGKR